MKWLLRLIVLLGILGLCTAGGVMVVRQGNAWNPVRSVGRSRLVRQWINSAGAPTEWAIRAGEQCPSAPFLLPTSGFIGFIWGDSFRPGHSHQGLDIFGGGEVNQTAVVASYSGYLTRLPDWRSSLILRIPQDPLQPGRQIWLYYTHMADSQGNSFIASQFPPGTMEVFVEAGTLLGYQGNYSGDPNNPVGVHLHFSIVQDDGQGKFRNELEIDNTLDPSAYLGLPLNAATNTDQVPVCNSAPPTSQINGRMSFFVLDGMATKEVAWVNSPVRSS